MQFKKFRITTLLIWGMLLCIDLMMLLWHPTIFGGVIVGFVIGGLLLMLLDNPLLNMQNKLINLQKRIINLRPSSGLEGQHNISKSNLGIHQDPHPSRYYSERGKKPNEKSKTTKSNDKVHNEVARCL